MNFDGAFRHIGTVDVQPLAEVIESFGEDAWNEFVRRQEKFAPHRQTQTIPLLYDNDMRHSDPTPWPRYSAMEPVLGPVLESIREANPATAGTDGYFVRIILTRLEPGGEISIHRDFGPSMIRSHRNHLAITTNEFVDFWIDGQMQHLEPGEIWEINNRRYHAVRNLGREPRIHMVLDYVVPGEEIMDTEGPVVA